MRMLDEGGRLREHLSIQGEGPQETCLIYCCGSCSYLRKSDRLN